MQRTEDYHNERLDHLGIVAGVCQEMGLASYCSAENLAKQPEKEHVAEILNALPKSSKDPKIINEINKDIIERFSQGFLVVPSYWATMILLETSPHRNSCAMWGLGSGTLYFRRAFLPNNVRHWRKRSAQDALPSCWNSLLRSADCPGNCSA